MVSFLIIIYLVIFRLEGYWLINVHLVTPFQIKLLSTLLLSRVCGVYGKNKKFFKIYNYLS